MKQVEKIAKLASDWWAKEIKRPIFDNGDSSGEGLFASSLASLSVKELTDEQVNNFKEDLYDLIINILNERNSYKDGLEYEYEYRNYDMLSTDYGPSRILKDIAEKYNIPDSNFPWKTIMWISRNHLQVRGGYSAESKMLFASKKYYKHKINAYEKQVIEVEEYDDDEWNRIHSIKKEDLLEDYRSILSDLYKQLSQAYPVTKEVLNGNSH